MNCLSKEDKKLIIAVDGFSSCGKSTFAKAIAARLGYIFIDTGAMYRAVAHYAAQREGIVGDVVDREKIISLLPEISISFRFNEVRGASDVYVNGVRREDEIRTIEVSRYVSSVSSIGEVREKLVAMQQEMGRSGGVVMDGRDIGTVVFPNADIKLFMTADAHIRAERRFSELQAKGDEVSLTEIEANIRERDEADVNRAISPLRKADDAITLDNSYMGVEEQMAWFDELLKKSNMRVEIDPKSGFCFGVVRAIGEAEKALAEGSAVYSLGDIVHNRIEVLRLESLGLKSIQCSELEGVDSNRILIRAHGEPPRTYAKARELGLEIIDATCPVVAKLQERVKEGYAKMQEVEGQVVLLGKKGHAEVVGLTGQVEDDVLVVERVEDLEAIDFARPVFFISQTTQSIALFELLAEKISERMEDKGALEVHDTICRQVSSREDHLRDFVRRFDVVIFVCGRKSSNGKVLFEVCREANAATYNIEEPGEIDPKWFEGVESVGICGATSTPAWLMEEVELRVGS